MIDIRRNDGAAARHFFANEIRGQTLADGDELHLGRNLALACVMQLRDTGVCLTTADPRRAQLRQARDGVVKFFATMALINLGLGIATALVGEPRALILDEPANGLDPAGIRWMRDLLRGYADRGGTVLLSSHLLHEIEIIADDLVLIGNGKIVAQGTKLDLLQAGGTVVRTPDLPDLETALRSAGLQATHTGDGALRTDADLTRVGQIARDAAVALTELRTADASGLEEMFLELTATTQREGAAA